MARFLRNRRRVIMLAVLLAGLLWVTRDRFLALVTGVPRTADAYLAAGIKAYGLGEFGDAIKAFEQAVKLDQSRAEARYFLAQALDTVGRTDEAIRQYQASAEWDPHFAGPHYLLAVIYRTRGNYAAAEAELKEAIRASPDFSGAHLLLGTLYFNRNDWENALTELTAAAKQPLAVRTDQVAFHLMLGATYAKLGRADEAAAQWRTVISLDSGNREADEQLHALDRR